MDPKNTELIAEAAKAGGMLDDAAARRAFATLIANLKNALVAQTASADALGKRLLGYTVAICILTALLRVLTGFLAWPELVKLWRMILTK